MSPLTLNPLAPIFAPKPPQKSKAPRKLQPIAPETKSTMNRISNLNVIKASSIMPRTLPKRAPITRHHIKVTYVRVRNLNELHQPHDLQRFFLGKQFFPNIFAPAQPPRNLPLCPP